MTRLLSQRASHATTSHTKPTFIDASDFSIIDVGKFFIPLDQKDQHNLLTLHTKIIRESITSQMAFMALSSVRPLPQQIWHQRHGHISHERLRLMTTHCNGISLKAKSTVPHCESCAITKSVRFASGNKTTNRDFLPFEKIGCDIWSHSTQGVRGYYHLIGFTCYRT